MPSQWWTKCKARPVGSFQEYKELIEGEYKNKVVFVDFFMESCTWCYYMLDDFNKLITEMTQWYGPEQVAFIKVNGPQVK